MRILCFFGAVIALAFFAGSESSTVATAAAAKVESESAAVSAPPSASARPNPYRLLGILDPDRERMVAFALKVPSDWRAKQEFHRKWEGAVGLPQIAITLSAPDGRSQIVYFPSIQYLFSEGPMTSNLRAQKRSFGLPRLRPMNSHRCLLFDISGKFSFLPSSRTA